MQTKRCEFLPPPGASERRSAEERKAHGKHGALTLARFEGYGPVVEFDTALHDEETETGPRSFSYVFGAMEGFEKPDLIVDWNADAVIADGENRVAAFASDLEIDRISCGGIFNGIRNKIRERVAHETFVAFCSLEIFVRVKLDLALAIGCGVHFVHKLGAELMQINWHGIK